MSFYFSSFLCPFCDRRIGEERNEGEILGAGPLADVGITSALHVLSKMILSLDEFELLLGIQPPLHHMEKRHKHKPSAIL